MLGFWKTSCHNDLLAWRDTAMLAFEDALSAVTFIKDNLLNL